MKIQKGIKYKTSTGYKVEVFKIHDTIVSCYELNEYSKRMPERKLNGDGFKVCIVSKDKLISEI